MAPQPAICLIKAHMQLSTCFIKTFRYIELSNGLRALLISDLGQEDCVCMSEQSEEEDDDDNNEEEEDDGGSEEDDDDGERTDSDENGEVRKKMKKSMSEKQVINLDEAAFH